MSFTTSFTDSLFPLASLDEDRFFCLSPVYSSPKFEHNNIGIAPSWIYQDRWSPLSAESQGYCSPFLPTMGEVAYDNQHSSGVFSSLLIDAPYDEPYSGMGPSPCIPMLLLRQNADVHHHGVESIAPLIVDPSSPLKDFSTTSAAVYHNDADGMSDYGTDDEYVPTKIQAKKRRRSSRTKVQHDSATPSYASSMGRSAKKQRHDPPSRNQLAETLEEIAHVKKALKSSPDDLFCPLCNREEGGGRKPDFRRHLYTHLPGGRFKCHDCEMTFSRSDARKRHLNNSCRGGKQT